jgi:DNA-binding GntR family transcriptional regulator
MDFRDRQDRPLLPLPLYFQLARLLTENIVRGRLAPGDRLTSEPDIGDQFGISRAYGAAGA